MTMTSLSVRSNFALTGIAATSALAQTLTAILSSGTLPPEWSSLTNLQSLYIRYTDISGVVPSSWVALSNLNRLDARFLADLKGEGLSYIQAYGALVP